VAASARSSRDAEKAAGVRAQQRLWGAALELRIRLQKALAGGNCLPRPAARAALAVHSQQVARRWVAQVQRGCVVWGRASRLTTGVGLSCRAAWLCLVVWRYRADSGVVAWHTV
jgi:hypothetical protein